MSLSSFGAFALTRAEMKNVVGGSDKKKCSGNCTVTNKVGNDVEVSCITYKVTGTKICGCGPTATVVKNGCAYS